MSSTVVLESLRERAAFMRESLQRSQAVTESMVTIFGSFDHRLSSLESDMRPMQMKVHAIRRAHENIVKSMQSAEVILAQFDICRKAELKIMKGLTEDYGGYLEAVNQLKNVRQYFSSNRSLGNCDAVLNYVDDLIATAIQKLGEDFKQLLLSYSKIVEPDLLCECLPNSMQPSAGSPWPNGKRTRNGNHAEVRSTGSTAHALPTLISSRAMLVLHQLAERMVQEGHQQQCIKIFRDCRATVLEQTLQKLGVERLSRDEVHNLQWKVLEAKIGNWIHFMRIAVKILFAGERKVCDQMFEGMNDLKDQCFVAAIANSFSMLLTFGDAIAKINRTPEKLFALMDMYKVIHELKPDLEVMFEGKTCAEMHTLALHLAECLAQTAHGIFGDFVEAVEKDVTRTVVPDGSVHPLTSYVMNYVKFLFDYQSTLKQIFEEISNSYEPDSQLASVTMQMMSALQTNMDGKSKQYRDPALAEIFLMNNVHYIVGSVRRSEAKDLLGDVWIQRHRKIVQQHANIYRRITWKKLDAISSTLAVICLFQKVGSAATKLITEILSVKGLAQLGGNGGGGSDGGNSSGVTRAREMVKERLRIFNSMFEVLHQRQAYWSVPDSELRESLRLAVIEILLPAYRSFINRLGPIIKNSKDAQKYMKYTPEDLEDMLNGLFEGKAPS